jgi:hypothetical protein
MAMIMPATEGKKYVSDIDGETGVGSAVASGAGFAAKPVFRLFLM